MYRYAIAIGMVSLLTALPTAAQLRPAKPAVEDDEQASTSLRPAERTPDTNQAGRVAGSSVGQVGQRQDRVQLNPSVQPMARIANRIQNRVESRIRNRIDRNYDPQASADSSFAVAEDETRTTLRKR